jgi:two-component system CAI-1 autoinducer sensor kinase/phosphatase CqsS
MGLMGACLFLPWISATPPSRMSATVVSAIFWIALPVFFFWMYLANSANEVWLGSMATVFLIYYHVTDWRLATAGSISGLAVGWLLFQAFGPDVRPATLETVAAHVIVLGFSWYMGLVLGISTSNLRREQLGYTLATMGIMAHELRTPIATMALIGEALRNEAAERGSAASPKLEQLSTRLLALVRNMNHQIDMQISNARLTRLPNTKEVVSAASLVQEVIAAYPYRSSRERACVTVQIHADFRFRGSHALFAQVLDNLIKNAFRSLAAATTASEPGDLLIEVGAAKDRGRIALTDRGIGMAEDLQRRIFQPFFSTNRNTGHGLGLAFCQRVVESARGSIRVKSVPLRGATFILELPTVS